jgi:hypothetical protein
LLRTCKEVAGLIASHEEGLLATGNRFGSPGYPVNALEVNGPALEQELRRGLNVILALRV